MIGVLSERPLLLFVSNPKSRLGTSRNMAGFAPLEGFGREPANISPHFLVSISPSDYQHVGIRDATSLVRAVRQADWFPSPRGPGLIQRYSTGGRAPSSLLRNSQSETVSDPHQQARLAALIACSHNDISEVKSKITAPQFDLAYLSYAVCREQPIGIILLLIAVAHGQDDIVRFLLDLLPFKSWDPSQFHPSALAVAAYYHRVSTVQLLLPHVESLGSNAYLFAAEMAIVKHNLEMLNIILQLPGFQREADDQPTHLARLVRLAALHSLGCLPILIAIIESPVVCYHPQKFFALILRSLFKRGICALTVVQTILDHPMISIDLIEHPEIISAGMQGACASGSFDLVEVFEKPFRTGSPLLHYLPPSMLMPCLTAAVSHRHIQVMQRLLTLPGVHPSDQGNTLLRVCIKSLYQQRYTDHKSLQCFDLSLVAAQA